MPRPAISQEQKKREGCLLEKHFKLAKDSEKELTQESLATEMGISQGLFGQWLSGITPIPDKRLVWLGARLNFNPIEVRPDLEPLVQLLRAIPNESNNHEITQPKWALIAKSLMAAQGITQEQLKETLMVTSRGSVGHYLSGRREPSIDQLIRLSNRLGVTTSELLGELPLTSSQHSQEILRLFEKITPEGQRILLSMISDQMALLVEAASEKPRGWMDSIPMDTDAHRLEENNESVLIAFSQRLNASMEARNHSPRSRTNLLVKWTGVGREGVRKWLKGKSIPRKTQIKTLATHLGCREEWLEYGCGSMCQSSSRIDALLELAESRLRDADEDEFEKLEIVLRQVLR